MKSSVMGARPASRFFAAILWMAALPALVACTPRPMPALFVPPSPNIGLPAAVAQASAAAPSPTTTPAPSATPVPAISTPCTNDLRFVQDLSIPDGTTLAPGEPVDKEWLVTNAGTCNWDARYRLKLISGDAMGAPTEQALYPARAGTQPTLHVTFTAPHDAGTFQSAWQAIGPDGAAFGEAVFLQISVSP